MKVKKILIHPGEINNFKSWVKNKRMIASHSDQHEIYIWDINLQQCVQKKTKSEPSIPNMILLGHKALPTYALAWSPLSPIVASGSRDGSILIWNLSDQVNEQGLGTKAFGGSDITMEERKSTSKNNSKKREKSSQ